MRFWNMTMKSGHARARIADGGDGTQRGLAEAMTAWFHNARLSIDRQPMFPLQRTDADTGRVLQYDHHLTSPPSRFRHAMNRPIRVIVYGFLIWWLWFAFVGLAQFLPDAVRAHPSFATLRLLILVLLVVGFAVDYLRRVGRSGAAEGATVGLTWMALLIANDIGHFLAMEPIDIGTYLMVSAPLYVFVPIITVTVFGRLMRRATRV